MDVAGIVGTQEESVVVYVIPTTVDVSEQGDFFFRFTASFVNMEKVSRHKVERASVELHLGLKILDGKAIMTKLEAYQHQ